MQITKVHETCQLKLQINKNILNKIFLNLLKPVEVAGFFEADNYDNIVNVKQKDGDHDSVYTPNNVINFHTHPISAYNGANCVWGWPSGEDIRESIKFGLAGNKAHLVFTNEGLYTIQVSPCKLIKLKHLSDTERCILIFAIEEYFKTTHEFRDCDEVTNLAKNGTLITPYSFIHLANNFKLANLKQTAEKSYQKLPVLTIDRVGHTGIHSEEGLHGGNRNYYAGFGSENEVFSQIPPLGSIVGNKVCVQKFCKIISTEDLSDIRGINCSGKENDYIKFKGKKDFENKLYSLITKFDNLPFDNTYNEENCDPKWNNEKNPDAWFYINFFPSNVYQNKCYLKNGKFICPKKESIQLNSDPFIRIFSTKSTGCKIKDIKEKNKFN
jgi:hypothetical protein